MTIESSSLKKVASSRYTELVAAQLIDLIASGELEPGKRLPPERELVERFGVARSVLREGLVRLQALGVIETHQGKGAFVAELPLELLLTRIKRLDRSPEDLLPHVWEMRGIIETAIAELAALRRTEHDIIKLREATSLMDEAIKAGDLGVSEDAMFHLYLVRATKNPALEQISYDLSTLIERTREHSLQQPGRPASSNAEHKEILRAVQDKDASRARALMEQHMLFGKRLTYGAGS